MNTVKFDDAVNSLLKKYIFSEDIASPEAKAIAQRIEQEKKKKLSDPKNQQQTADEVDKLIKDDGDAADTKKPAAPQNQSQPNPLKK